MAQAALVAASMHLHLFLALQCPPFSGASLPSGQSVQVHGHLHWTGILKDISSANDQFMHHDRGHDLQVYTSGYTTWTKMSTSNNAQQ